MKIRISQPRKGSYLHGFAEDMLGLKEYADVTIDRGLLEEVGLAEILKRHRRCLIFDVDGKLVFLDEYEDQTITQKLIDTNTIDKFSLILKLQYAESPKWKVPVPITAWTLHERTHGLAATFHDLYQNTPKTIRCGFHGRAHKHRIPYLKKIETLDGTDAKFWSTREHSKKAAPQEEYFKRRCSWQTALVLNGRKSGMLRHCKVIGFSWQHAECAAMGIPMICTTPLPTYIPFEPGKHFVLCRRPKDLDECIDRAIADAEGLGARARQWYLDLISPEGKCKTFMRLMTKYDVIPVQETEPPKTKQPKEIEGHMRPKQLDVLNNLANNAVDGVVCEIGAYKGRSASAIGWGAKEAGKKFIVIDQWAPYDSNQIEDDVIGNAYDEFLANMTSAGLERDEDYTIMKMSSTDAAQFVTNVAFLHIDADHTYEAVKRDLTLWIPNIAPGGVLACHDYCRGWKGVIKAWEEIMTNHPRVAKVDRCRELIWATFK